MRVLLVDDDAVILEDIRRSVNWDKLGVSEVDTALDAEGAREILEREPVDIIVSDIEMPKESGLDLLRWFREKRLPGKFLLLTSYGSFDYASTAVKLHAEEYLMKPFNVETMELVLQKMIKELREERQRERASIIGQWMVSNYREARLAVWSKFLFSSADAGYVELMEKLPVADTRIDTEAEHCLVLSKVTNLEQDFEIYGKNLVAFILENVQSEVLFGTPENENVICREYRDHYILAAVCRQTDKNLLRGKCGELQRHLSKILSATVTYCLMDPCKPRDFKETFERGERLLDQCVSFYGEVFSEEQTGGYFQDSAPVLQMELLEEYLDNGDRKGFLSYLKKELEARVKTKALDARMLKSIHREVQQATYAHLAKRGIQISLLVNSPVAEQMSRKADQSASDMLRSENYILDKIFEYESELERSKDLITRINEYIHRHYRENIGRNEIGAEFYLVPEYLAKLYKKKTGVSLKDYINEYRIEQAKRLLKVEGMQVGEAAIEVGFENISYFSTLFKKSTGMTPMEYKKQI